MDVTIYYTGEYEPAPSAIERITTPLESGWDRWRVCFRNDADETDAWFLSMECRFKHKEKGLGWHRQGNALAKKCGSMADYTDWLERNVSLIEVDGRPFWANPSLEGAE